MPVPKDRQLRILFACGREPDYIRNHMLLQALSRHQVITATHASRRTVWRYANVLVRIVRALRCAPDVIILGFYAQPLMPILRFLTSRPIVLDAYVSTYDTVCSDRQWFRPRSLPGRTAYVLDSLSCRWADRVLFDTRTHCYYFSSMFGLLSSKLAVIYVGCDETHFRPAPSSNRSGAFKVFTYGSFLRLHGIEYVVRAAKRLESHQDIEFTIAGDGPYRSRMEALAHDLGLQNVHFPGWISFNRLPDQIADADLCLGGHFSDVPKASRVIPTKTFQFLAMGQPTIVGNTPANREVMTHRRDAYFCAAADPTSIAEAILDLRDDSALRCKIREGGLALYRRRFTVEATAERLQGVLDDLVP